MIFWKLITGLIFLSLTSCGVAIWERERLGDPTMILDEDIDAEYMEQHFLPYREGSSGGTGAAGGGCGC